MNASVCFCIASNLKDTLSLLKFVLRDRPGQQFVFCAENDVRCAFKTKKGNNRKRPEDEQAVS